MDILLHVNNLLQNFNFFYKNKQLCFHSNLGIFTNFCEMLRILYSYTSAWRHEFVMFLQTFVKRDSASWLISINCTKYYNILSIENVIKLVWNPLWWILSKYKTWNWHPLLFAQQLIILNLGSYRKEMTEFSTFDFHWWPDKKMIVLMVKDIGTESF